MLKRFICVSSLLFFVILAVGCNGARTAPKANVTGGTGEMSVLSLRGDTSSMTQDQIVELQRVGKWMDRDIIKQLSRAGYKSKLIKSRKAFKGPGNLLIIKVAKFKPGNKAARVFVGFGAGGSSLDLNYQLLDSKGKILTKWDDGVGSSKGGTYCAQTLNRRALVKLGDVLNG
ncbi:MAG: DUF4410 domain-containing protein [Desulfobacterium sp.]|nr:DUF4410 domain-containing protein [Desulfobacterium sp.]